jgi:metal-responsive CopG/Arc/MetJ family transcriptional regulator
MRLTLSIPDAIVYRFQVAVPPRQRSKLIARLLEQILAEREDSLASACRAANQDMALAKEIDEWQAFDDGVIE